MNLDTRKEIRKVLDDFIDWYECQLQPYKEIREDALTAIEKIMEDNVCEGCQCRLFHKQPCHCTREE